MCPITAPPPSAANFNLPVSGTYLCCSVNLQRSGAVGACEAHNLEAVGSKPTFASLFGPAVMDLAINDPGPPQQPVTEDFFFVEDYALYSTDNLYMTIGVD